MKIFSVDQARNGGWALFDYDNEELLDSGSFSFPSEKYDQEHFLRLASQKICELFEQSGADAIFIEDIQLQNNAQSFKALARLQGALISEFIGRDYLFDYVTPVQWQAFCGARGRTTKEVKAGIEDITLAKKTASKIFSIMFVKDKFGIETLNDNIADAICIGWYVVNNIELEK